jgi:hypothetical protein
LAKRPKEDAPMPGWGLWLSLASALRRMAHPAAEP